MIYPDQHTPWRPGESVLEGDKVTAMFFNKSIEQFALSWIDTKLEIQGMMWSAKTYVKAKNTFKK